MSARGDHGWHKVASDYYEHRKFDGVTALGETLWNRALAYAARNRTDGFVPRRQVVALVNAEGVYLASGEAAGPDDAVAELVRAGLWEQVDGGWMIHDYLDFQTSAAHQAAVSAARAASGAKGGAAKAARRAAALAEAEAVDAAAASNLLSKTASKPLPELELELPPSEETRARRAAPSTAKADRAQRATRIAEGWEPADWDKAREVASGLPLVDLDHEHRQFVDWALAKGATNIRWDSAFHGWLRRAQKFAEQRGGQQVPPRQAAAEAEREREWRERTERHQAYIRRLGFTVEEWDAEMRGRIGGPSQEFLWRKEAAERRLAGSDA